jgi:hypothetical protein
MSDETYTFNEMVGDLRSICSNLDLHDTRIKQIDSNKVNDELEVFLSKAASLQDFKRAVGYVIQDTLAKNLGIGVWGFKPISTQSNPNMNIHWRVNQGLYIPFDRKSGLLTAAMCNMKVDVYRRAFPRYGASNIKLFTCQHVLKFFRRAALRWVEEHLKPRVIYRNDHHLIMNPLSMGTVRKVLEDGLRPEVKGSEWYTLGRQNLSLHRDTQWGTLADNLNKLATCHPSKFPKRFWRAAAPLMNLPGDVYLLETLFMEEVAKDFMK